jgi:arylsulfatase
MPRGKDILLLAATVACVGLCACIASPEANDTGESDGAASLRSIIVVSIDTLRADHLGCYGYFRETSPTIDALAEESVLFERAMAPMSMTLPAHTSLFTGVFPLEHGVLANIKHGGRVFVPAPGLRSFAEFARDRGYQTAAFVSAPPLAAATGIAAGFDVFKEPEKARSAGETNEEVFRWLDELGPGPFLLWVHYFDPHQPYRPPEEFQTYRDDEELDRYLEERRIPAISSSPRGRTYTTRKSTNLYDGEIRYADHELGRLIERLRKRGRWQDSALVLVSDHGESIGDHGYVGHEYITREQLQVLMMLRVPGSAPARFATPVSLVDTLPTLIALLQDDGWQGFLDQASGRDALAVGTEPHAVFAQRAERERPDFIGPGLSLLSGKWRYVYEPEKENQLFDWSSDPHELDNVVEQHAELARSLEDELLERVNRYHVRATELRGDSEAQGEMDPELYEKLRALGYVD